MRRSCRSPRTTESRSRPAELSSVATLWSRVSRWVSPLAQAVDPHVARMGDDDTARDAPDDGDRRAHPIVTGATAGEHHRIVDRRHPARPVERVQRVGSAERVERGSDGGGRRGRPPWPTAHAVGDDERAVPLTPRILVLAASGPAWCPRPSRRPSTEREPQRTDPAALRCLPAASPRRTPGHQPPAPSSGSTGAPARLTAGIVEPPTPSPADVGTESIGGGASSPPRDPTNSHDDDHERNGDDEQRSRPSSGRARGVSAGR